MLMPGQYYCWVNVSLHRFVILVKQLQITLYHIQTLSDASAADDFRKHFGKGRNCSQQAISPFATMLSTFFKNSFLHLQRVCIFLPRCFQSHLLQMVVCEKGVIIEIYPLDIRFESVHWIWKLILITTA